MLLEIEDSFTYKLSLKNKIIEVLTGEGKSILLGLLATFLALIDYDVYISC